MPSDFHEALASLNHGLGDAEPVRATLHRFFYAATWSVIRVAFRFHVEGGERLSMKQPIICMEELLLRLTKPSWRRTLRPTTAKPCAA